VIEALADVMGLKGVPEHIRSDNALSYETDSLINASNLLNRNQPIRMSMLKNLFK
jgi:hypothetical protein